MRAVATDIDGTFLTSQRDYDRRLFAKVYARLVEKNIRFIVASGDQYYFLRSLFPKIADQLAFVAENGVLTIDRDAEVHCGQLAVADVRAGD
ncbi:HAD hydrolase family protein [Limosilactobacillus sp.]|uniref:HAD hydrolase family protein n=1 Tax=Limosilactobacillus sp. TaxID=2773925 RepID=UPI003EFD3079